MTHPKSLFEKVWDKHVVVPESDAHPAVLYIDLQLLHEVTSPQAFSVLRERGLQLRRPDRVLATMDHSTPTLPPDASGRRPYLNPQTRAQVDTLEANCQEFGVELHGWDSPHRGIVHVMGPELGATQPGMTIVCGDSHTATHGAFGALAFGIGTTEVGHVMVTQCLLQRKPKSLLVRVDGRLSDGVTAKDLVLHIIGRIGVNGGTGHVIEYAGEAIRALDMEGRMTVCNMSIEAGARAGMIAPDHTTLEWLRGRERVPVGLAFDQVSERWLALASDADAVFDREVLIHAGEVAPTITYGTHPGMVTGVHDPIPVAQNAVEQRALDYMGLESGKPLAGKKVDVVFLGSCTNSRITDLRAAAQVLRGRRIARGLRMLVVPGSEAVRREAESEGLHRVFLEAGAEWREPGCSMCLAMNGDTVAPGQLAVSTSNRNFEGRQGSGSRTVLASPVTAAACAVTGTITDPRPYMSRQEVA